MPHDTEICNPDAELCGGGMAAAEVLARNWVWFVREGELSCKSCQSENQRNLNGEIALHFPGLKGLDKPVVWVFPKLLVCLDCGFTEFAVPGKELSVLAQASAAT
jgi:hypothetical protein